MSDNETSVSSSSSDSDSADGGAAGPLLQPTQLSEPAEGRTSKLFTKSQREYLNSLKTEYIQCSKELKAELSLRAAEHMLDRMEKKGLKKSSGEKKAFRANVRRWFQQNCRARKDLPRWAIQWTGRLVFYNKNPGPVNDEWKRLRRAAGEIILEDDEVFNPDSDEDDDGEVDGGTTVDADEGPFDDGDDDDDSEGLSPVKTEVEAEPNPKEAKRKTNAGKTSDTRRRPPPVMFFQKALSNVYSQLPSLIRKEYERTAVEWRTNGPDEATKRRLADKDLPRISRHFAETVHRQMNVRVAMLVTYVGESGGTVISFLDYTNDFGTRSFTKEFGPLFDKSGVMGYWGAYSRGEFEMAASDDQPKSDWIRKRGKPLLSLQLDDYGEPVIPDPSDIPPGEQPNEYLKRLIRNIVIYSYARACGRAPKDVGPPWGKMQENLRSFVGKEYLPDSLAANFQEPTGIKVKPAREILNFWYMRQCDGLIPLTIHNYVDDEGDLVPSLPRERVQLADGDPDYEDDGVILKVPVGPVSAKGRRKSAVGTEKKKLLKEKKGKKKQREVIRTQHHEDEGMTVSQNTGDGSLGTSRITSTGTHNNNVRTAIPPRPRQRKLLVDSDSDPDTRSVAISNTQDSPPPPSPTSLLSPPPPSPTPLLSPPPPSPSPLLSPPPAELTSAPSSTSGPVSAPLEALNTDPLVASLDESIRNLVLDAVKRHLERPDPAPAGGHQVHTTDHSTPTDQLPNPHPTSAGGSSELGVPGPSISIVTPQPPRRTRRTEEEVLLEAAAKAGAKSGRRVRKAKKIT